MSVFRNLGEPQCETTGRAMQQQVIKLEEKLASRKEALQDELSKIDDAIQLLKDNPSMQKLLDALCEVRINY